MKYNAMYHQTKKLYIGRYDSGKSSAGNTPPMIASKCPVLRLDTQYRMHPEIASWPNR